MTIPRGEVQTFRLGRTLKIGSFHIGSALVDILVLGVWNRVLISDLGVSAALVALLAALRYFMAPLTVWVGNRSDTRRLFGRYRISYIYLGRFLTWLSLPLLPLVIIVFSASPTSGPGWFLALAIFLLFGLGTVISGGTFLALVRESAPPARQGLAVVIVQTVLLAGFAIVPILFAVALPVFTVRGFWTLVAISMVGAALAWTLAVRGEERYAPASPASSAALSFPEVVRRMRAQPNTRTFFLVLAAGSIALFAQDAVLEPYGADVFGLEVGQTTLFNSYYGTGLLLAMLIGSFFTRRWTPDAFGTVTVSGLLAVAVSLALLATASLTMAQALLLPALFLFGIASGVYTLGGLSLMIAMTDPLHAGAYLGLWTMVQFIFRGVGIALGGAIVTLGSTVGLGPVWAYNAVFLMELVAALAAALLVLRVRRHGFLVESPGPYLDPVLVAAAD